MYDELVKSLRICAVDGSCRTCPRFTQCTEEEEGPILAGVFNDAADAIERLSMKLRGDEAAIVGMKREIERMVVAGKPRWIPVTERLPDYPGRFMCYYEVNDREEIGHCIDWGRYDPDDGWYVSGVTHWMPLPEPPKEAK